MASRCGPDSRRPGAVRGSRLLSPRVIDALERLTYAIGSGATLQQVRTDGTSPHREAAIVDTRDVKDNAGRAYPTTPGNFERYICS